MNDNYLQMIYNFAFSTYNKLLFYNIFINLCRLRNYLLRELKEEFSL